MTDQTTNQDLLATITAASANPSTIMQRVIDLVEDAHDGVVNYVDPSNPAVTQLEVSAVIHASTVQQSIAGLRKLYPILAQTPEDLYNHMSYRDYINRFASPAVEPFIFFVPMSQFVKNAVVVPGATYSMITIPRDTSITVNKYVTFTLQYPINIKYYNTGSIEVSYDTEVESPLQALSTNIIVSGVLNDPNSNEKWINFVVPATQVSVAKVSDNIQAGRYFVRNIDFVDQYCMARVWYRNSATIGWQEFTTTYSPTVYDETVPTVQLKVIDNTLTVSLPLIYQTKEMVIGEVRIDIYTTKGAEVIVLSDYPIEENVIDMTPLDPNRDVSVYTAAALNVSIACRSSSTMSSGKDAIGFEALRSRVINNSVGEQVTPITNKNIEAATENLGFQLVQDVDVVTNRIFLATRSLPTPTNPRLVTSANIGIATYVTDNSKIVDHPWVKVHNKRSTFLSKNLYRSDNGILSLLSVDEVNALKLLAPTNKIKEINSRDYLYSPFYYVLDSSSSELDVRAYHLDNPVASNLNFKDQNSTLQLIVNTASYFLSKLDNGYRLTLQTNSGSFYKSLPDSEVMIQLGFQFPGSTQYAYWNGQQVGRTDSNERIFQFDLITDYDINEDDQLIFTNGKINEISSTPIEIDLTAPFDIFHITTSITQLYKPSSMDDMIGKFMLPTPCAAITYEKISLNFGSTLSGLWSRGRVLPDSIVYEKYNQDIVKVAQSDIFADPAFVILNGEVVYNYLYHKGDTILDEHGDPIIEHYKGSVVLKDGQPVISGSVTGSCEFDMLMVDGRHYFVTDDAFIAYNNEFIGILVNWITNDIPSLQARALEKTKIFFYPKNQLGRATIVVGDYAQETIDSGQSINIDIYVTDAILQDTSQQSLLKAKTISYLANWISSTEVSVSVAIKAISDLFGQAATAVKVDGLGPYNSIQLVNIAFNEQRLTLKRILDVQQDGTFIIREDVTMNFLKAHPNALSR